MYGTMNYIAVVISYASMGIVTKLLKNKDDAEIIKPFPSFHLLRRLFTIDREASSTEKARKMDSRAENDLEIRLPKIANRISRTPILSLIRISPPLIQRTLPRKTSLTKTLLRALPIRDRIRANANILITTLHNRKVVSRTVLTSILTIPKLKQSLCLPLACCAPFGVAGEAHAEVFEGSGDSKHLLGFDVGWVRAFEHLEAAGDLVEGDLFGEGAIVPDVDGESV